MTDPVCIIIGNQQFLREVAIPALDDLEGISVLTRPKGYDLVLKLDPRIMAGATEVSGWLVPIIFVGSWIAGKALDELYDRVMPVLKKHLMPIHAKRKVKYAISFVLNKVPENVSILIVAIGETEEELSSAFKPTPICGGT